MDRLPSTPWSQCHHQLWSSPRYIVCYNFDTVRTVLYSRPLQCSLWQRRNVQHDSQLFESIVCPNTNSMRNLSHFYIWRFVKKDVWMKWSLKNQVCQNNRITVLWPWTTRHWQDSLHGRLFFIVLGHLVGMCYCYHKWIERVGCLPSVRPRRHEAPPLRHVRLLQGLLQAHRAK